VNACRDKTHRPAWSVRVRRANYSAFNGYRRTPSAYSLVHCPKCLPPLGSLWRTRAAYVDALPDAP
jgi:hypothetical protein